MDFFYLLDSQVESRLNEYGEFEDYILYAQYGGPEGIDRYNYWVDEITTAKNDYEGMYDEYWY